MLDDLREQASSSDYFNDEAEKEAVDPTFNYKEPAAKKDKALFLGMTPNQRFVIAVMLMLMVCIMGVFFLVLTEKVVLPFF